MDHEEKFNCTHWIHGNWKNDSWKRIDKRTWRRIPTRRIGRHDHRRRWKVDSEDGETRFREYEITACKKASKFNNVVISCGGGCVLNKINIDNLKQNCHIVLLQTSAEEIYKRCMKDGKETRPVIDKADPKAEIEKVLIFRKPFYDAAAEIIVDTTEREINEIVKEIIEKTKII